MGCYNEYPLGVNGIGDWFLSPPPYGNVAHARNFSPHIGGMGAYFGPDSTQINMSTMEGLGASSPLTTVFNAAREKAVSAEANANPQEHHDSHELEIPDWLKYAGGGLALLLVLKLLSKKK